METGRFGNASKTDIYKFIENLKCLNGVKQTNKKWMSAYLLGKKLWNQETEMILVFYNRVFRCFQILPILDE